MPAAEAKARKLDVARSNGSTCDRLPAGAEPPIRPNSAGRSSPFRRLALTHFARPFYYSHPQNQERTAVPKSIRITLAALRRPVGRCWISAALAIYLITHRGSGVLSGGGRTRSGRIRRRQRPMSATGGRAGQQPAIAWRVASAFFRPIRSTVGWRSIWPAITAKRCPPQITNPRIDFHSGAATLACTYRHAGHETVMSIAFDLYLSEPNVVAPPFAPRPGRPVAGAAGRRAAHYRSSGQRFRPVGAVASDLRRSGGAGSLVAQRRRRRAIAARSDRTARRRDLCRRPHDVPARRPNWLAASGTRRSRAIRSTDERPETSVDENRDAQSSDAEDRGDRNERR